MKTSSSYIFAFAACCLAFAAEAAIPVEADLRSTPDGEHYTVARNGRVIRYAYLAGAPLDTLFDAATARECPFTDFDDYIIDPRAHHIVLLRETQKVYRHSRRYTAYLYDIRRNRVQPLTELGTVWNRPVFSPDGRHCAYVVAGNVYIRKFEFNLELPVTRDAHPDSLLYAAADWLYEEEFGVTTVLAWSPESDRLAFLRTRLTDVPRYHMPWYGDSPYPTVKDIPYPVAGAANPTVDVMLYDLVPRRLRRIAIPDDAEDIYIPRLDFTLTGGQLAVFTLNRPQTCLNLYAVAPASEIVQLILRETDEDYIDPDHIQALQFTNDGFLHLSERDGYRHIYHYTPTGILRRQITSGTHEVTRLYGLDPATGNVYYQAVDDDTPVRRTVYAIDSRGIRRRLTLALGCNDAVFSANYAYFVNRHSSIEQPPRTTLHETRTARELRLLHFDTRQAESLRSQPHKSLTTIHLENGLSLYATLLCPADFDPQQPHPLLISHYGGPGSQKALDAFEESGWEADLVREHGYVVATIDPRGTEGRGRTFRHAGQLKLGVRQADDIIDATLKLAEQTWVDKTRIALWGWSFGGLSTLLALSRPDHPFHAGIAVAPVTDWRFYDTAYTERYLRTPQENPDGYAQASPVTHAASLSGNLLIVHGTADDNVHLAATLAYTAALDRADRPYRIHLYKDQTHSLTDVRPQLYSLLSSFLLLSPPK
jgi:dipeptidyl-peptidase-4